MAARLGCNDFTGGSRSLGSSAGNLGIATSGDCFTAPTLTCAPLVSWDPFGFSNIGLYRSGLEVKGRPSQ